MSPTPSTKIQFRDIKDHADLMDAHVGLIRAVFKCEMFGWDTQDEVNYLKSEIAHFLRAQSAAEGIAVECPEGPFEKSGASADHNVNKNS